MHSLGPYDLESELGHGAVGRVYNARHRPTGALRALKVLDGVPDTEALDRFRREIEALAKLGGQGVVGIHEAGVHEGRLWFAMDVMPGGSLAARIRTRGRLPWREAALLVASLARSLHRAHELGLVHRDVKPDNVLFDDRDEPRLADFGCVRDVTSRSLTQSGAVIGTPAYMAPEQLVGERVDARADVFALGVILYELVSGMRPHAGTSLVELHRQTTSVMRVPLAASVGAPVHLDRIVGRALEPDVARRYANARLLALDLEALASGKTPDTATSGRSRGAIAAVAAILLGVAGLALGLGLRDRSEPEPGASPVLATRPPPRPSSSSTPAAEAAANALVLADRVDRLLRERKPESAADECRRTIASVGSATWALVLLARSELEAGRPVEAATLCSNVLTSEPRHVKACLILGEVLTERLELDAALRILRDGVPWQSDVPLDGSEDVARGRAMETLVKRLGEGDVGAVERLLADHRFEKLLTESQRNFARAYDHLLSGNLRGAASSADELCRLAPNRAGGWYLAGVSRLGKAATRESAEAALPKLERAVAIDPGHRLAWDELARARAAAGDREHALVAVERALELGSDSVACHALRRDDRLARGDLGGSEADARRVMALEPNVPAHALGLARTLFFEGKLEEANALLAAPCADASPESKPLRVEALVLRARAGILLGSPAGALEDTIEARRIDVRTPSAAGVQALAFAQLRAWGESLEAAKQSLKHEPDDVFACLARGIVGKHKGDAAWKDEVRHFLERAGTTPEAALAREILEEPR